MKFRLNISSVLKSTLFCASLISVPWLSTANAQTIGDLIWEDNFDTLDTSTWNIDIGDGCDVGICGWGNAELQWYSSDNVSIGAIPGEPGNNALVLDARNESINGYSFTSGKVTTENKFSLQYGMIETRIRIPDLDQGLWPAAWMLGTSTLPWPRKGEVDMMEMGQSFFQRDRQGHPEASVNEYVGSNVIFYAEAACVPGNETCAASSSYDVDSNKPYVSAIPMNDRFLTYRTYWTADYIRFTVEDDGIERDLYEQPFQITDESNALQAPFFLLLNLAVGGNFTDAAAPTDMTAPLPASMYIDYIRVYELDGQGEVFEGNNTEVEDGVFGVFTETTPVDSGLDAGVSSDIFLWDLNSVAGTEAPFEGEYVMNYAFTGANTWFGSGILTRQARDMSNFADGVLRFNIKIPADVSFRIGVTDNFTNENWLTFPANTTTYGLVRNGDWGQVEIPVSDLRGPLIALQSMQYLFAISSDPANFPTGPFEYAIDNVIWDSGNTVIGDSDNDGVNNDIDQCPGTSAGTDVDSVGCPLPIGGGDASVTFGTLTGSQSNTASWTDVSFDEELSAIPIVVLGAPSYNGIQPVSTRVRNVTTMGFQYQLSEWNYLDGRHAVETLAYVAAIPGTQNWGGLQITSGQIMLNSDWSTTSFTSGFDSTPMVLAQQVTNNEADTTTVRIRNVGTNSFQFRLQEEEAGDAHGNETVHYIAFETGMGSIDGFDVGVGITSRSVNQAWYNLSFGDNYENPQFLASMQSAFGSDTATVRYQNLNEAGASVKIEEETSSDTEVAHAIENVGWLVFGVREITISDSDNDGVPDNQDACPNTASGVEVDATGCEISNALFGVQSSGEQAAVLFVNTSDWADVHYRLNGGGQQNIRMTQTGSQNIYTINGLNSGDQIEVFFTYWDANGGFAVDSETVFYTH